MIRKIMSIMILIGIWWIVAIYIDRAVILPLPNVVLSRMFELATSSNFYISTSSTLLRISFSFLIAMIIGILLGIFSGLFKRFEDYISPIITLLQSIPQIAFILIFLVWLKSVSALIIIVVLMLLPIFYHNTVVGIKQIDSDLIDVIHLYHHSLCYNLYKVYIPLIKGYILSAINTCLPLAFKTSIMAEIFVQTREGIGNALYVARTQIDMVSIFAWTIWMIIIVHIMQYIFSYIQKKCNTK